MVLLTENSLDDKMLSTESLQKFSNVLEVNSVSCPNYSTGQGLIPVPYCLVTSPFIHQLSCQVLSGSHAICKNSHQLQSIDSFQLANLLCFHGQYSEGKSSWNSCIKPEAISNTVLNMLN